MLLLLLGAVGSVQVKGCTFCPGVHCEVGCQDESKMDSGEMLNCSTYV